MSKMTLNVSDGLFSLRRRLAQFDTCGVFLSPEEIRCLLQELKDLGVQARQLENTQSRLLWNEAARDDLKRLADQGDIVVAEAARPGSNVRLLAPNVRAFSDGRPRA